jgi:hypothetical protein
MSTLRTYYTLSDPWLPLLDETIAKQSETDGSRQHLHYEIYYNCLGIEKKITPHTTISFVWLPKHNLMIRQELITPLANYWANFQ